MKGPIRWRATGGLIALVFALLVGPTVSKCLAAAPLEIVGGWEGDGFDEGYGFATIGVPLGDHGGVAFPVRLNANYLYYNYVDAGETINVSGPGAAALFGIRKARPRGVFAALTGADIRWETRERQGSSGPYAVVARVGVVAQVEGDFGWTRRLYPFFFANYAGSTHYIYGRTGFRYQLTNLDWSGPLTWSVGLEGVAQGNADTDAIQGGGTIECSIVHAHLSLSVRGGYKDSASDEARRQSGYLGVGLWHRF
jgi:hypothetical protein